MPTKIVTETQFARLLGNSPLQVEMELLQTATHKATHVDSAHMLSLYKTFDEIKNQKFDGMVITGAPVELMEFEEVNYWDELCEIMEWSKTHVTSTLHICWGAQAGLYYHYGIKKYTLDKKMFGIFPHSIANPGHPLFTGLDSTIYVPHSRHTRIRREDVIAEKRIELLSESTESGVYIMQERGTRDFFITGHSEYALYTLDGEYRRDIAKGLPIELPLNYYRDNDPTKEPVNLWQATARKLFGNWIKYYCR